MPAGDSAGAGTQFSDGNVAVVDRVLLQAFPGVDPVDLREGVTVGDVKAGQILCQQGDDAQVAWIVATGRLRATIQTDDGPTTEFRIASRGRVAVVGRVEEVPS